MKMRRVLTNLQRVDIYSAAILIASVCFAIGVYTYALSLPPGQRIRGDASVYLTIAGSFTSISDAMAYVSDRSELGFTQRFCYGFPLFLYIVKLIFSPKTVTDWALNASYVQFSIHILACLCFYQFFLKKLFQKTNLSKIFAALAAGMIIAYPTLITYTTVTLTDVFCADLMMFVAVFYFSLQNSKKAYIFIPISFLCGLILGYAILVRPSFWPPIMAFYFGVLIEALTHKQMRRNLIFKVVVMCFGTSLFIVPAMHHVWEKYHEIGIQDPEHFVEEKKITLQDGLANVRVYWSQHNPSYKYHPGIYDRFLKENYYDTCTINSLKDWMKCLLSKPFVIPIYFWKKTLALFDVPNIQPYAVDITPRWFIHLERLFGMLAYCGFITFLIMTIIRFFTKMKITWFGWSFTLFIIALVIQHSMAHVEGRFVFSTIPFLITALFLGFAGAKQVNRFSLISWISIMLIAGVSFLYQTYVWDIVQPF